GRTRPRLLVHDAARRQSGVRRGPRPGLGERHEAPDARPLMAVLSCSPVGCAHLVPAVPVPLLLITRRLAFGCEGECCGRACNSQRGRLSAFPLPLAAELGFTRVRPVLTAEVGYIRLRLEGEGGGMQFNSTCTKIHLHTLTPSPTLPRKREREQTEFAA